MVINLIDLILHPFSDWGVKSKESLINQKILAEKPSQKKRASEAG
jgi:hypothetical protein